MKGGEKDEGIREQVARKREREKTQIWFGSSAVKSGWKEGGNGGGWL